MVLSVSNLNLLNITLYIIIILIILFPILATELTKKNHIHKESDKR